MKCCGRCIARRSTSIPIRCWNLTDSLLRDLSKLFATKGQSYIYIANGHGAWEAVLTNVLSRGDKILVLESGRFAVGWGNAAAAMGAEVEVLKGDWRRAVRPAEVEARLRQDKNHTIKAILVAQVDTASGVFNDIEAIGKAVKAAGHPALFMVDTVASLGCMPFEMDGWGIDVAMSGSQKGLMTPPGLGFVAANDRAREVHKKAGHAHALLGLDRTRRRRALPQICRHRAGASVVRAAPGDRHAVRGRAGKRVPAPPPARRSGAARGRDMGRGPGARLQHRRASERSNTVTTVMMSNGHDPAALHRYCKEKCGVVLGVGIGELQGQAFRIAHMGHVNAPMILGALGVIEVGLNALEIPHGNGGTEAAINWLGESVSA